MANSVENNWSLSPIKDKICDITFQRNKITPKIEISHFKNLFINDMSIRRLSAIQDINELFDTLERLELGSISNLYAYKKIVEYLKAPELDQVLCDFETRLSNGSLPKQFHVSKSFNHYQYRRDNNMKKPIYSGKSTENGKPEKIDYSFEEKKAPIRQNNEFSPRIRREILDIISREIGKKFRNLGRELDFSEGELECLEMKYATNIKERGFQLVNEFLDRFPNDEKLAYDELCNALDRCKRIDLRKKVREILLSKTN